MTKSTMMNKCSSFAGHFDHHAEAWVQYHAHCPMQHVQGYIRKLCMLSLGNYSLSIATVAARATDKTTMIKHTTFAGRSDGHCDAVVRYRAHYPMEEVQGFTRSLWMPQSGEYLLR
jgi:hypothetical protein